MKWYHSKFFLGGCIFVLGCIFGALWIGYDLTSLIKFWLKGCAINSAGIWLTVIGLFATAFFGLKKLQTNTNQLRAQGLSNLMQRWDSKYLTLAKDIFYPQLYKFDQKWNKQNADQIKKVKNDPNKQMELYRKRISFTRDHFRKKLSRYLSPSSAKRKKYILLLRIADFFESIAIQVEKGYLHESDILAMFGYHLRAFHRFFAGYIEDSQDKELEMLGWEPVGGRQFDAMMRLMDKAQRDENGISYETGSLMTKNSQWPPKHRNAQS